MLIFTMIIVIIITMIKHVRLDLSFLFYSLFLFYNNFIPNHPEFLIKAQYLVLHLLKSTF